MKWDRVARRQGGIIRHSQMCAAGMTLGEVATMLARRVLLPTPYRGVYRVAGSPPTAEAQAWLTVLAAKAVLSYASAAQWWELPVASDGFIHLTRHDRRRFRAQPGVRVHRTLLTPDAVTHRFGLPITNRRETLLDCLGWVPRPVARTLIDRAFQQSWIQARDVQRRLDDQSGRWGNRQLTDLLRESRPGAEAESERRLQNLLVAAGMVGWWGNYLVRVGNRNFRLDVAFPESRLYIEVDGWAFHRTKERRDGDILRSNALAAAGWQVLTFTWEDVNERPEQTIALIRSVLARASAI